MPDKKFQKLPCGDTRFDTLLARNFAYVDKTMFIEQLENSNYSYPFIVRPRRFGKTLFVNTLAAYYDINQATNFEKLFAGTYIYDHKTPLQGKYRILRFNFSGITSGKDLIQNFSYSLIKSFKSFLTKYPIAGFEVDNLITQTQDPATLFNRFCAEVKKDGHRDVYLIIDEYDQFANEILSKNSKAFLEMTADDGFLRSFYAAIKDQTDELIDRIFITGVTSVSLDSISSGFNIASNISADENYTAMFGFTNEELLDLINRCIDVDKYAVSATDILARMKTLYNGYRFSLDSKQTVFNPEMCLYYLNAIQTSNKEPRQLLPPNTNQDISKIANFIALCDDKLLPNEICKATLNNKALEMPVFPATINLNKVRKLSRNEVLSVMLYMGFLTWSLNDDFLLSCPNRVIKEQFFGYYFRYILEFDDLHFIATPKLIAAHNALHQGQLLPLLHYVSEMLTHTSANHSLAHFSENSIQIALQDACHSSTNIKVSADEELIGKGYCDVFIEENTSSSSRFAYLIELKYLSCSKANADTIAQKYQEGLEQMKRYASADKFANLSKLSCGVAVFVGTKLVKTSFIK